MIQYLRRKLKFQIRLQHNYTLKVPILINGKRKLHLASTHILKKEASTQREYCKSLKQTGTPGVHVLLFYQPTHLNLAFPLTGLTQINPPIGQIYSYTYQNRKSRSSFRSI